MATNSELAILSLLAERPRHGYEIEQTIEQRGMRNWTEIGFSSIYYLLNKLEQSGLIQSRLEASQGKGPSRKVYRLTNAGRNAWQNAALDALSNPEPCYQPVQIGLSNLPLLPKDQALLALQSYLKKLETIRAELTASRMGQEIPLPYQAMAMFGLSLAMIESEIQWLTNFLLEFAQMPE